MIYTEIGDDPGSYFNYYNKNGRVKKTDDNGKRLYSSRKRERIAGYKVQAIGMDGFHRQQDDKALYINMQSV